MFSYLFSKYDDYFLSLFLIKSLDHPVFANLGFQILWGKNHNNGLLV